VPTFADKEENKAFQNSMKAYDVHLQKETEAMLINDERIEKNVELIKEKQIP
jgi:hypothetical protein